jgi:hypothetical protein
MSIFKNKVIIIFGGTGSFGQAFLKRIINLPYKQIRIFSRDEKKQDDLRNSLKKKNWHSKGTLNKAIKELKEFGFIEVSRQGGRNKCSLYALTFRPINICKGKLDIKHTDKPSNLWKKHEPIKIITAADLEKEKNKQLDKDKKKLIKDYIGIQKRHDEINIATH